MGKMKKKNRLIWSNWIVNIIEINVREYQRDNKKKYNPEKLVTECTQDEEKQHKNTTK